MHRSLLKNISLSLAVVAACATVLSVPGVEAANKKKPITITERIQELSSKIDAGQKSNELTLDEATDLRGKITKINEKIDKCQSKNAGKLSYKDENSIEKDLNKVSTKLFQQELAKRTAKPSH